MSQNPEGEILMRKLMFFYSLLTLTACDQSDWKCAGNCEEDTADTGVETSDTGWCNVPTQVTLKAGHFFVASEGPDWVEYRLTKQSTVDDVVISGGPDNSYFLLVNVMRDSRSTGYSVDMGYRVEVDCYYDPYYCAGRSADIKEVFGVSCHEP